MKKFEKLTKAQELQIPTYRDKWLSHGLSIERADRAKAEEGVKLAYAAAKMTPPKYIIWLDSPHQGAVGAAFLAAAKNYQVRNQVWDQVWDRVRNQVGDRVWDQVGDRVRNQVGDQVWNQVGDQVWDQVGDQVGDRVWDQVGDQVWDQVGDQVWDQVWDQVGDRVRNQVGDRVGDRVRNQVGDQVWDQVGDRVRNQVGDRVWDQVGDRVRNQVGDRVRDQVGDRVRGQVNRAAWGQHEAGWMSWLGFWDDICKLDWAKPARGIRMIAENSGWWWPFENFCILTERPKILKRDSNNRLHCEDSKAIEYPDGWGFYCWHGIRIESWIVENPELITVAKIESEGNAEIRRIMITKYGMAKYLEESGASEVDRDRDTKGERILYQKKDAMGIIKMIKLENSTAELDGSKKYYTFRVSPDVRTCQEAVAYLYSREPKQYQPSVES